jgi:acetyl-CoA C-acetyltransferase
MAVVILGAKRTAIGKFLGTASKVHPSELGSAVLKHILEETKVNTNDIGEVIVGNILSAGLGQGIGRQVSIKAGLPIEVPAYSLNMVCGSGMKSLMNAYQSIQLGQNKLVVAGGVESMSQAPFVTQGLRSGQKLGHMTSKDHIIQDALTDAFADYHMGITAENIADKYQISRQEQDAFAVQSQVRAIGAIDSGRFKDEIVPIEIKTRKETIIFDTDEHPNRQSSFEKLGTLRPAFKKDGTVTAGNASGINDGASMILLGDHSYALKHNLEIRAEVIAIGQGGVDPSIMGMGPVPAIKQALNMANLTLDQMDLIELNEAFAAQSLGVIKELANQHEVTEEWILERATVNGGAIALGHPVGVSGNRIVVTLLHEMEKRDLKYGLASLCIGGGMGTAIIIKRG